MTDKERIDLLEKNLKEFKQKTEYSAPPTGIVPSQASLKDRDIPIDIKPGYSDDLIDFFAKVNSPPKWRTMG